MNHYETLGIPPSADQTEIKAAWRRMSSEHHPDKGGSTEKQAAINEAYRVLGDVELRAKYDRGELEDTPLDAADMCLLQALQQTASRDPSLEMLNLVETMRQMLENEMEGLSKQIKVASDQATIIRQRLKSITFNGNGRAILIETITKHCNALEDAASQAEQKKLVVKEALRRLGDYEDSFRSVVRDVANWTQRPITSWPQYR